MRSGQVAAIAGIPIVMSPHMRDGEVYLIDRKMFIGTYPKTPVQLAGEEGRWLVRNGLADVLEWLGEKVGPMHPPSGVKILQGMKDAAGWVS